MHLAQLNIARLVDDQDSPTVAQVHERRRGDQLADGQTPEAFDMTSLLDDDGVSVQ